MKKQFILLLISTCLVGATNAQSVKKPVKDTVNAYRANDRLKNAGPVTNWPLKTDSTKKITKPTDSIRRSKQAAR